MFVPVTRFGYHAGINSFLFFWYIYKGPYCNPRGTHAVKKLILKRTKLKTLSFGPKVSYITKKNVRIFLLDKKIAKTWPTDKKDLTNKVHNFNSRSLLALYTEESKFVLNNK